MRGVRFLKIIAWVGQVVGPVTALAGYALDARDLAALGIQPWIWQAVGAAIYFASVSALLYGAQRDTAAIAEKIDASLQALIGERQASQIVVRRSEPIGPIKIEPVQFERTPIQPQLAKLEQQISEPVILDVTPEFLYGLYDGRTTVQGDRLAEGYIGKFIQVSGPMHNVSNQFSDGTFNVSMHPGGLRSISMEFDEKWFDRLSLFPVNTLIKVRGRIKSLGSYMIMLTNCDIVS
jgi:hypothetical protein